MMRTNIFQRMRHLIRLAPACQIRYLQPPTSCYYSLFNKQKGKDTPFSKQHKEASMKINQPKQANLANGTEFSVKPSQSSTKYKLISFKGQIQQLKGLLLASKQKNQNYLPKQKQYMRQVLHSLKLTQIKSANLEDLKIIGQYYLLVVQNKIDRRDVLKEKLFYENFLALVLQQQQLKVSLMDLSIYYMVFSKFQIMLIYLHRIIPTYLLQSHLRNKQIQGVSIQVLINFINGVSKRKLLLKPERQMLCIIINHISAKYYRLSSKQKIGIAKSLIDLNINNRFAVYSKSEEKILQFFYKQLKEDTYNIWQTGIFQLINHDLPNDNRQAYYITEFIVSRAVNLIDSKGNLKQQKGFTSTHFYQMLLEYSKRYPLSKLDENLRKNIQQYFYRSLCTDQSNKNQGNFAIFVKNGFFYHNQAQLNSLIIRCNLEKMNSWLIFELSRLKIHLQNRYFIIKQQNQSKRKDQTDLDLYLIASARLQQQLNPSNTHLTQYIKKHQILLKQAAVNRHQSLLKIIMDTDPSAIGYLFKNISLYEIVNLMPKGLIKEKYNSRLNYLMLMVKYRGKNQFQQSKWIDDAKIKTDLVFQILQKQRESKDHISSNVLSFLTQYVSQIYQKNEAMNYLTHINILSILSYLIKLTHSFKAGGQISFQNNIYTRYWQLVSLFITHSTIVMKEFIFKNHFQNLVDHIIMRSYGHFDKTNDYRTFIGKLMSILGQFKPQYEIMSKIIIVGMDLSLITHQNYKSYLSQIKWETDLKGQHHELVNFWNFADSSKIKYQPINIYVKYMNHLKSYSAQEVQKLKQEIPKYDFLRLVKCSQLFNLPLNKESTELYYELFNDLKRRHLRQFRDTNIISIFSKINKYLNVQEFSFKFQEDGSIGSWVLDAINFHCINFGSFTLEYHRDLLRMMRLFGLRLIEYQDIILSKALLHKNLNYSISMITELIKINHHFTPKDMNQIENMMKQAKTSSWLQVFLLLEQRILKQTDIIKVILMEQTNISQQVRQSYNNELIHDYLSNKHSQAYKNSYFSGLLVEKTKISKPNLDKNIKISQILSDIWSQNKIEYGKNNIYGFTYFNIESRYVFLIDEKLSEVQQSLMKRLLIPHLKQTKFTIDFIHCGLSISQLMNFLSVWAISKEQQNKILTRFSDSNSKAI